MHKEKKEQKNSKFLKREMSKREVRQEKRRIHFQKKPRGQKEGGSEGGKGEIR